MSSIQKRKKVAIIGSGFVGASCAHWILSHNLANVSLIDRKDKLAKGRAIDLFSSSPLVGHDLQIQGGSDYGLAEGADIVVITAGLPRKPGMTRADLLSKNALIMKEVCDQLKQVVSTETVFIVVSNPLDAMVYQAHKILKVPRAKILGMAGVLDTARFKAFVAEKLKVSIQDISALVLGGHGDTMVPLTRLASVGGIPLEELISPKDLEQIVERTRHGGGEIVSLLETSSAHYAPAASVVEMVASILRDERRIFPCAALLEGEYGERGIFVGVPCQLNGQGLDRVIEVSLNTEEQKQFKKSIQSVRNTVQELNQVS